MDKKIVRHIAELSNIELLGNEEERMAKELTKIVEYISKINEASQNLKRDNLLWDTLHSEEKETPLRNDETKTFISLSSLNKLSTYIEGNQFKVLKAIE